eukprot:2254925-Rhodomonas_salina.2
MASRNGSESGFLPSGMLASDGTWALGWGEDTQRGGGVVTIVCSDMGGRWLPLLWMWCEGSQWVKERRLASFR